MPSHQADLPATWDRGRLKRLTPKELWVTVGLLGVTILCLAACVILGRPWGIAASGTGVILVASARCFRRPLGAIPATLGPVLGYVGALWSAFPAGISIAYILSITTFALVVRWFALTERALSDPIGIFSDAPAPGFKYRQSEARRVGTGVLITMGLVSEAIAIFVLTANAHDRIATTSDGHKIAAFFAVAGAVSLGLGIVLARRKDHSID